MSSQPGTKRDDNTKALIEVGKNAIVDSIKTVGEFIKLMVPLTTGLIATYFALLEFLGVKTADKTHLISSADLVNPAFSMLASLIVFIIISFPIPRLIDLRNLRSIRIHRNTTVIYRYVGAGLGMAFFLYGIYLMILILQKLISAP